MDTNSNVLINGMAQNYRLCLADFPKDLKPEHLDAPVGEQALLFAGLQILHTVIGSIYDHFAHLIPTGDRWTGREYCYKTIEGPLKLLLALGTAGQLVQDSNGYGLQVSHVDLDQALKRCGGKDPNAAFAALKTVGFDAAFYDADGLACPGGYKKCATVVVRHPTHQEPLLRAMVYYALRLPKTKGTKKGEKVFPIFLRSDFRPLLPGYTIRIPHFPTDEEEVTRTFDPGTLEIWRDITGFMASRYPQCRLFFRVPRVRNRGWVADYSTKDNDYGLYSIFVDEDGIQVRIVLIDNTIQNMLDHVHELTPQFQESYLNAVACKDCVRCGKHVFYTHGDHVHRLCRSPWFISPHLRLEDMPDIKHLIDFRLANLQ